MPRAPRVSAALAAAVLLPGLAAAPALTGAEAAEAPAAGQRVPP